MQKHEKHGMCKDVKLQKLKFKQLFVLFSVKMSY